MKTRLMFIGVVLTTASAFSRAAAQGVDSKAAFDENCKKCHGVRGVPPKLMKAKYPKLATFDAAFAKSHSQDSIVTALSSLQHDFRDVVGLVDIGEFSYADAAQILDIPIGTVMWRLHRGRRQLKQRLAEEAA